MRRREFIGLVGGAAALPCAVWAQQSKRVPVIGLLWSYANAEAASAGRVPMLKGLSDRGYIPGKTFILEERFANGIPERYEALSAELAGLKPDVIISQAGLPVLVLHRATTTIPVVVVAAGDPILMGLASSLSKPGGNITGTAQMNDDVLAKRVQLLRQAIPKASRFAYLNDPRNLGTRAETGSFQQAVAEHQVNSVAYDITSEDDIRNAFNNMKEKNVEVAIASGANFLSEKRKLIANLAIANRVALMGPFRFYADDGSLMSYGADLTALYYRTANFVDKILKGENVADIPFERPTKFDLCLNLKTAEALGIQFPSWMLTAADQIIE